MYELELKIAISEPEERIVHAMMERVYQASPYEAACEGFVESNGAEYHVRVHINATAGCFVGEAKSPQLQIAVSDAEKQIGAQIEAWRAKRYSTQIDATSTLRRAA